MTHLSVFVLTNNGDEEEVDNLMESYSADYKVAPYKHYPMEQELKWMEEHFGTDNPNILLDHIGDWCGAEEGGVEDGKLYWTATSNPDAKWDWNIIGGRWTGHWHPDDKMNITEYNAVKDTAGCPFAIVTPDGAWHERGEILWFGGARDEMSGNEWEEEVDKLIQQHPHTTIVVVDCHGA
jgi:hypothetical protein